MTQPTLDYAMPTQRKRRRPTPLWQWGVALGLILLVGTLLMPRYTPSPYHGNWGACVSHLGQIRLALSMYADDHRGTFPPDFAAMKHVRQFNFLLVCPSSNDTRSAATQPADLRRDLEQGGHCSYVLVQDPARTRPGPNDVIAFEWETNHYPDDFNVLFGDGRVERHGAAALVEVRNQYDSGVRPIRITAKPIFISPRPAFP